MKATASSGALLFDEMADWLIRMPNVQSAVLFGSSAVLLNSSGRVTEYSSDFDVHLIVAKPLPLERVNWVFEMPRQEFCFQACRSASGGVRKVTAIFSAGQIDMIVVPLARMRLAALGLSSRLYTKLHGFSTALNEMATCLHSGYRFLKGGATWSALYKRVAELPGVRLSNLEIRNMADASICDILWILQKLKSGELIAAQHVLHSRVSDTNLRLWRELRQRQGLNIRSFGLGRGIESSATEPHCALLSLSGTLNVSEIQFNAFRALSALKSLMREMELGWQLPPIIESRLIQFAKAGFS